MFVSSKNLHSLVCLSEAADGAFGFTPGLLAPQQEAGLPHKFPHPSLAAHSLVPQARAPGKSCSVGEGWGPLLDTLVLVLPAPSKEKSEQDRQLDRMGKALVWEGPQGSEQLLSVSDPPSFPLMKSNNNGTQALIPTLFTSLIR